MDQQWSEYFESLLEGRTNIDGLDKDMLVTCYLMARDGRDEANKEVTRYEKLVAIFGDKLNSIMSQENLDGFKTPLGTVSRKADFTIGCGDWPIFWEWLYSQAKQLEAEGKYPLEVFSWLHKRVSKEPIIAYLETTQGGKPPGIDITPKFTISVRKAKL